MKPEIFIQNGENVIPYKIFNNDNAFFKSSLGFTSDIEATDYNIIVSKCIEFPLTIVFFELFPVSIEKELLNIKNDNHLTIIKVYSLEEWDFIFHEIYINLANGVEVSMFTSVNTNDLISFEDFSTNQFIEEIEFPCIDGVEVMTYIRLSIYGMFIQTVDSELNSLEKIYLRLGNLVSLDSFNSDL